MALVLEFPCLFIAQLSVLALLQAAMRDMLSVIVRPQSVGSNSVSDGERVGKGPGRRRRGPLLHEFLVNDMIQP